MGHCRRAWDLATYVRFHEFNKYAISFIFLLTRSRINDSSVNDDPNSITEVLYMVTILYLTTHERLAEHSLTSRSAPQTLPDNTGIVTLFYIEFMKMSGQSSFDIYWAHELIRAADIYKAAIGPIVIEQVKLVGEKHMQDLRDRCKYFKKKRRI